jgi:predicted transposase/invertase (TIGR01784 family)
MTLCDGVIRGIIRFQMDTTMIIYNSLMPDLYETIDFNKGYEFLEQEIRTLFTDSEVDKKYTDKLAKLYLKSGKEKWILVHIEVQGNRKQDFPERMFRYFYRVYDKYNREIFALALFSDASPTFKPNQFEYEFFDTKLTYAYRIYKILEQNEEILALSQNPFSMAVLAGLYVVKGKKDMDKRFQFKVKLMRLLLQKDLHREEIEKLFVFIDGLLKLPTDKEKNFEIALSEITKRGDNKMGLSWDRSNLADMYYSKGKSEGKAEGKAEGEHEKAIKVAKALLAKGLDVNMIVEATELSVQEVKTLKKQMR